MPVYVITGVSKGLGYEFLRLVSEDPNNLVIGIVRDKPTTVDKVRQDVALQGRSNIHICEADITNYDALQKAAAEVKGISGGSVDYIISNAGLVTPFGAFDPIGVLGEQPLKLEQTMRDLFNVNVIGNIHLFNLFIPLLQKGQRKKAIVISSCLGDTDFTNNFDIDFGPLYATSKAAVNMVVAKFSAQYKKEGILFMGICPGMVKADHHKDPTPEQIEGVKRTFASFKNYSPNFKGSDTPQDATRAVMSVWENASIDKGNGGDMLSHFGNKQWF